MGNQTNLSLHNQIPGELFMKIFSFLFLAIALIPNSLFAQFDDWDYSNPDSPVFYEVVKNDKGLYGLSRIKDKKLVIPYKFSNIYVADTPEDVEQVFINVYDESNNAGIYSLKDNKLIIPCKYNSINIDYKDFYPNDDDNPYLFCGFAAEVS